MVPVFNAVGQRCFPSLYTQKSTQGYNGWSRAPGNSIPMQSGVRQNFERIEDDSRSTHTIEVERGYLPSDELYPGTGIRVTNEVTINMSR